MEDYKGILALLSVGAVVAGVLGILQVRVANRRPPPPIPARVDEAQDHSAITHGLSRFYVLAVLFVAFGIVVLQLAPWAASLTTHGLAGMAVAGLFALPILVGFVHVWAKGGLDW